MYPLSMQKRQTFSDPKSHLNQKKKVPEIFVEPSCSPQVEIEELMTPPVIDTEETLSVIEPFSQTVSPIDSPTRKALENYEAPVLGRNLSIISEESPLY